MSGVIPDPTNPEGPAIIADTGQLAGPAYVVRSVADPTAPTMAELQGMQFIGWVTDWSGPDDSEA